MKDYCSYFPEVWQGEDIGSTCCKKHDNDSGEKGSFNFYKHQVDFYKCLRSKLNLGWSIAIVVGGTLAVIVKSPWLIYRKIRYRYI